MKFGVVGYGVVGRHMEADILRAGHTCHVYDKYVEGHNRPADQLAVNACAAAFVCVSTPQGPDGACDVSAINDVFTWLRAPVAIIRSTVPPGTTARLQAWATDVQVVFCPEFIGEGVNAPYNAMRQPPFVILGGADTRAAGQALRHLYNAECEFLHMDSVTAETIKYGENSFLATKVTFFNEWYDICQRLGANFDQFVLGLTQDYRIGRSHTTVYADNRGWSGRCLPKDTSAMLALVGEDAAPLLAAVRRVNDRQRGQA